MMHSMGRESFKFIIGSIAVAACFFGVISTAQAADDIVSEIDCCTFAGGPFTQAAGEVPRFVNPANADSVHNVTSTQTGPDGAALFESDTIPFGQSAPVRGAQYLADGTYPFVCTIHSFSMTGDLIVSGGTAVPRPKIALAFPAQKLKMIRKSGKVRVKVRGVTASSGIRLVLSKGKLKLGSVSRLSVAAGKSRIAVVKLTRKGKNAIRNGRKVRLLVKGTVKGGKATQVGRTLR